MDFKHSLKNQINDSQIRNNKRFNKKWKANINTKLWVSNTGHFVMFWLDKGPGMINSPELSTRQSLKYLTQMVFQKKPVWEFGWVRKQSTTSLEYMPKSGKAFSGSFVNVGLKKRRYSSYKIFRDDCTVLPVWFSIWLWNQFRPPTVVLKWNIYWRLSLSSSTITDIYIYPLIKRS